MTNRTIGHINEIYKRGGVFIADVHCPPNVQDSVVLTAKQAMALSPGDSVVLNTSWDDDRGFHMPIDWPATYELMALGGENE